MSREHVRRQINLAAIYLFCTLCVSFFIGSSILICSGSPFPAQLAGGLIIAFIGFRMLFPAPSQAMGSTSTKASPSCRSPCPACAGRAPWRW